MAAINPVPDAMSDVLSLMRMRLDLVCSNDCAASFSLNFRARKGHFHMVERGSAFLVREGKARMPLETRDVLILPPGAGHVLCSDPPPPPVLLERAIREPGARSGRVFHRGIGNEAHTR